MGNVYIYRIYGTPTKWSGSKLQKQFESGQTEITFCQNDLWILFYVIMNNLVINDTLKAIKILQIHT